MPWVTGSFHILSLEHLLFEYWVQRPMRSLLTLWRRNTKDNVPSLSLSVYLRAEPFPTQKDNYLGKKEILTQTDAECFHCVWHLIAFKITTKSQLSFLLEQMEGIWHHVHNAFPGKRLKVCLLSYLVEKRKRTPKKWASQIPSLK